METRIASVQKKHLVKLEQMLHMESKYKK